MRNHDTFPSHKPDSTEADSGTGGEVYGEHDAAITEIIEHAQELGLTPEETAEAVEDYKKSAGISGEYGSGDVAEDGEGHEDSPDGLSVSEVLNDPSSLTAKLEEARDVDSFEHIEQGLNKLADDLDGLEKSLAGLGEALRELVELLQAIIVLIHEVVELIHERENAESDEDKADINRKIQDKINEFGRKWGRDLGPIPGEQ